jgi:hypothetical protein
MFLNYFDVLILKIIFKNKKYYFNIFLNKKYFFKINHPNLSISKPSIIIRSQKKNRQGAIHAKQKEIYKDNHHSLASPVMKHITCPVRPFVAHGVLITSSLITRNFTMCNFLGSSALNFSCQWQFESRG